MKSMIKGAFAAVALAAFLTLNAEAKTVTPVTTVAASDTGKMAKGKMDKMAKMDKMGKMDKMAKDTGKMAKGKMSKMGKMGKKKMAKDTGKM